jgi:hypothetical protein
MGQNRRIISFDYSRNIHAKVDGIDFIWLMHSDQNNESKCALATSVGGLSKSVACFQRGHFRDRSLFFHTFLQLNKLNQFEFAHF